RREEIFRKRFEERRNEASNRLRGRVTEYLVQALDIQKLPTEDFYTFVGDDDINPVVARRWYAYVLEKAKLSNPIWAHWQAYAKIPVNKFAEQAAAVIHTLTNTAPRKLNSLVVAAFMAKTPGSMREVAETYGKLLTDITQKPIKANDKKSA